MATVNQIGSALIGQTGTGKIVGTVSPLITLTRTDSPSFIGGPGSTFTLNGVCGRLLTGNLTLAANQTGSWTWNNTFLKTTSQVFLNVTFQGTSTTLPSPITCRVTSNGVGSITIFNYSPNDVPDLNGTVAFNYIIF